MDYRLIGAVAAGVVLGGVALMAFRKYIMPNTSFRRVIRRKV